MGAAFSCLGALFLQFIGGILNIFVSPMDSVGGIFGGIFESINVVAYVRIISMYSGGLNVGGWIVVVLGMILMVALIGALVWVAVHYISKFVRRYFTKKPLNDDLIAEVRRLQKELAYAYKKGFTAPGALIDEPIAYAPSTAVATTATATASASDDSTDVKDTSESRFYKLIEIDKLYQSENPPIWEFKDDINLEELCDNMRHWLCKERKLFYEPKTIRLFVSALATTRFIILQGISGTGKTSLPYALGLFLENPTTIASVQPSWRDRTEIFGYFNEFTKRYNETEILKAMYEARWSDSVFLTVIDEANISRIEYYFAELLSIYELPARENWIVSLTSSGWDTDPKFVEKGQMKLPENMWYVATINNDDSTFAVSDKVYDRAIPININSKGIKFTPDDEKAKNYKVSYKKLEELFADAQVKYKVSQENIDKFNAMDDYVIEHFRLAFGNRIVKQLNEFVPVYVACGGTEIDGLDYILANKILRKFESLNLNYIRDEIDGYIDYLNVHFGEENMNESKEYLNRLKKLF
ncbi:MAG: hypothetical protein J6V68_03145 [Clostridia bacterium]|nr:hypothetical protein [Clostridia bacterium]